MISQFGHRYRAKITAEINIRYVGDRQIFLFNYFKKHNCKLIAIKEIRSRKKYDKSFEIEFEDGEGGVAYENIGEIIQLLPEVDFEKIQVIK